jgi:hypothetical protein
MKKERVKKDNWIEKLHMEHQELLIKINKLEVFLADKAYNENDTSYDILYVQLAAMNTYIGILQMRIGRMK